MIQNQILRTNIIQNGMTDDKENYLRDLRSVKGLRSFLKLSPGKKKPIKQRKFTGWITPKKYAHSVSEEKRR